MLTCQPVPCVVFFLDRVSSFPCSPTLLGRELAHLQFHVFPSAPRRGQLHRTRGHLRRKPDLPLRRDGARVRDPAPVLLQEVRQASTHCSGGFFFVCLLCPIERTVLMRLVCFRDGFVQHIRRIHPAAGELDRLVVHRESLRVPKRTRTCHPRNLRPLSSSRG